MSANQPPASHLSRGLDSLWRVLSAPQTLLVLVALLAVTLALAAIIPQLPAGLDAAAANRWLTSAASAYGGAGAFLRDIGGFTLLATPWTRGLLAALALHLSLRSAGQLARLIAARRGRTLPAPPPGLPFAAARLPGDFAAATGAAAAALTEWAGRPAGQSVDADAGRARLHAARRPWAALAPLLGYAGPLLVLGGLLLDSVSGWRASDLALGAGETAAPAAAQGVAVTLSAAGEGIAQLTLHRGAAERVLFARTGAPATWGNVWAALRATGPALTITAEDAGGQRVPVAALDGPPAAALSLRFGDADSEQAFVIPSRNLVFRAVSYAALPDRNIDRPVFFVEGYREEDPAPGLGELVEDAATVEWEGLTLAFRRDRFVVVDLAALPGLPLLLAGGLLTLAGAVLALWFGVVRAWVDVTAAADGPIVAVRVAGPALPQQSAARLLATLTSAAAPRGAWRPFILPAAAMLLLAAGMTAGAWLLPASAASRGWAFLLRAACAGLGLGALLPACFAAVRFALAPRGALPPVDALPAHGRAVNAGRAGSVLGFPLLTAALLAAALWNLQTHAGAWHGAASDLWLLTAWLLTAGFLHATSSWRPPNLPAWFAALISAAALGAAALSVLTCAALLVVR